jgi:hypothetical protein
MTRLIGEDMKGFPPEVSLPGNVAPNGYPLLESVLVEPGRPSTVVGYNHQTSSTNPAPVALIDTGADRCTITADLKERLDLLPQQGKIIERGYSGRATELDAYSIGITMGGAFYCQVRVAAVLAPKEDYGYEILIGCNVLQHCAITYGTHNGEDREFTLVVPRAMGLV